MGSMKFENYQAFKAGKPTRDLGIEAWFGYVITGHASQGAQWDTVYVINEGHVFNRTPEGYKAQNRWLYTAVTRAAKNLVLFT